MTTNKQNKAKQDNDKKTGQEWQKKQDNHNFRAFLGSIPMIKLRELGGFRTRMTLGFRVDEFYDEILWHND